MAISATREAPMMGEINMTPLIDVMLVLLVMFIITIPLQTHAVKLDLPRDCPGCPFIDRVKNKIVVTTSGAILWNGFRSRRVNWPTTSRRAPECLCRPSCICSRNPKPVMRSSTRCLWRPIARRLGEWALWGMRLTRVSSRIRSLRA